MTIASASTIVKFHDFPSGNVVHNYQPGTQIDGPIRSISWSKDGKWLALVPYCGFAEIISVKDHLKLIHTIQTIEESCCACFQNTTKKNIAIGTKNGEVVVYDIKSRNVKKRYPRTTSVINRVAFTAKDSHIVAACESGEILLYSTVQNSLSGTFKVPRSQTISALRTNPIKRNYIVAGSDEGVVAVWDIHGTKNKFFVGSHKAPVTAVAFSPVNADLVVSAGLDRQFCFYDIAGNKCIGNIFVENSMTSVDFSPDGKYIVMASQRGKIYVYDSKNFQQPIYTFTGHNSAVHHLFFRKSEDYESSFNTSPDVVPEELQNIGSESSKTTESLDLQLEFEMVGQAKSVKSTYSHPSASVEDSFLAAMGMDHNNTADSSKPNESVGLSEKYKKLTMHGCTPTNPSKILQNKIHGDSKNPLASSTPDIASTVNSANPTISPITNLIPQLSDDHTKKEFENMEEFIKGAFTKELKVASEELKNDMKFYSAQVLSQIRDTGYSLLMQMVKESVKMETKFKNLRMDLVGDVLQNEEKLYEENILLKQKIAHLEEELTILKNNQFNKDC